VRRWLERFGAWVVAGVGLWITFRILSTADLGAMWGSPGAGGLRFWLGVDLAIALPVSWVPLVADYNRFARRGVASAAGTYWGYAAGNIWFYSLGALLVLGAGLTDLTPAGVGDALTVLAGGWIVLLALLAGETDEAFADIYSAAVSTQNLNERIPQRAAVVGVAVAGVALAALLGLRPSIAFATYEAFLFLLGSVFVPLFGVFVAHYFVVRGRTRSPGVEGARDSATGGEGRALDVRAFAAWLVGFLIYQWSVPTGPAVWTEAIETLFGRWLGLSFPLGDSVAGASIPSFAAALVLYVALNAVSGGVRRRKTPPSAS
jgi:NCS1 family nucleobase:cation symporter-1